MDSVYDSFGIPCEDLLLLDDFPPNLSSRLQYSIQTGFITAVIPAAVVSVMFAFHARVDSTDGEIPSSSPSCRSAAPCRRWSHLHDFDR